MLSNVTRAATATAAAVWLGLSGLALAGCDTSSLPTLTGCISDADAQGLLTRTDAKLGRVVCAGDDWAMATYTYTTANGKTGEPGEAVLVRYDGTWHALVQGVSTQEICTPTVKEQIEKAPSPINELSKQCS